MVDVIIIGNGPAGLSAALYVLRANLSAIVIGKDNGSLGRADKIENYFGLEGVRSGEELISSGKRQVLSFGGTLLIDEILAVSYDKYFIITGKKEEYKARAVIFATGSSRKVPKIAGFERFAGKGISYCAVCDAFFYRNKDVAVLGNGEYALHEVKELLPVAKSVTLLTDGLETQEGANDIFQINTSKIKELAGEKRLEKVIFSDNSSIDISGLFVALGSASAVDLARKIGAVVEGNAISVNDKMETTVPGLFAAGDCIGGVQQISVAVGEGAKAGLSAINYVRSL